MEWSFSTKSSSSSHNLFSFKVNFDDDKSLKTGFDSLPGKKFMTMSNAQGLIENKLSGIGGHHKSFVPPLGHNGLVASTMSPVVSPCSSVIGGTTELRMTSNILRVPTQMTIFYAGQVCVYDDISQEKAQAIMLLAGNGHSIANKTAISSPSHVESQQKSVANLLSWKPSVAVPQARKASLARFLEKRKERVMNAAPYKNKQSLECKSLLSGLHL